MSAASGATTSGNVSEPSSDPPKIDELYAQKIREALISGACEVFANTGKEKAAAIMREMVSYAKREVCLFCNEMSAEIYNIEGVVEAFCDALERGVKFRVLIQQEHICSDSKKIINLFGQYKKLVEQRSSSQVEKLQSISVNFCVVDDTCARWEDDRSSRKGKFYTHSYFDVQAIKQMFEQVWEDSGSHKENRQVTNEWI